MQRQKYLGSKGLIALITLLSAFIPMSTDLYLPALPVMVNYFHTSAGMVNLTMILFFVFFAAGLLIWGPMSDRYGRRPVLLAGLVLYIISSILCATAVNIYLLIFYRVIQAVGGGAANSVAMAMSKDAYSGRKRESVLALVNSAAMIVPLVAPVIGALILNITSFRGMFWILTGISLIAFTGSLALQETLEHPQSGSVLQSISRIAIVLRNPGFTLLTLTFSIAAIPFFAFLTSSAYIYVNGFGLSEQAYSFFFALNAVFLIVGPLLYLFISRQFKRNSIINFSFALLAGGGLLVVILGKNPWFFALSLLPGTLGGSVVRPPSANLILEQQQKDTGSAVSLMTFFSILISCIGMMIISYKWSNPVLILGLIYFFSGLICAIMWLLIHNRSFIKHPD